MPRSVGAATDDRFGAIFLRGDYRAHDDSQTQSSEELR